MTFPLTKITCGTVPDSQTQQHQCFWVSTLTELCAIKRTSRRQRWKVNARNNIIRKLVNLKWGCKSSTLRPGVSPSATQLPNTPALRGQCLHTRASWTRPYTTAAESSRAALNQQTWTVYIYWPVSHLLTSGGLLPGTHTTNDRRQTPIVPSPTRC